MSPSVENLWRSDPPHGRAWNGVGQRRRRRPTGPCFPVRPSGRSLHAREDVLGLLERVDLCGPGRLTSVKVLKQVIATLVQVQLQIVQFLEMLHSSGKVRL